MNWEIVESLFLVFPIPSVSDAENTFVTWRGILTSSKCEPVSAADTDKAFLPLLKRVHSICLLDIVSVFLAILQMNPLVACCWVTRDPECNRMVSRNYNSFLPKHFAHDRFKTVKVKDQPSIVLHLFLLH